MKQNRSKVMRWIGLSEGGLVDHPRDPGGRTNKGITQRVYTAWLRQQGRADQAVDHITQAEAEAILFDQYFDPVRFDQLPSGVDYAVADYAVNSGVGRAARELQRALGDVGRPVTVDGHVGAVTLAAANKADAEALVNAICDRRMRFLRSLSTFDAFGRGWTRRVEGEDTGPAKERDTGVRDRGVSMARDLVPRGKVKEAAGKAPEVSGALGPWEALIALLRALWASLSGSGRATS